MTSEDRERGADGADEEVGAANALGPEVEQPLPDDRPHIVHDVAEECIGRRAFSLLAGHPHGRGQSGLSDTRDLALPFRIDGPGGIGHQPSTQ